MHSPMDFEAAEELIKQGSYGRPLALLIAQALADERLEGYNMACRDRDLAAMPQAQYDELYGRRDSSLSQRE